MTGIHMGGTDIEPDVVRVIYTRDLPYINIIWTGVLGTNVVVLQRRLDGSGI